MSDGARRRLSHTPVRRNQSRKEKTAQRVRPLTPFAGRLPPRSRSVFPHKNRALDQPQYAPPAQTASELPKAPEKTHRNSSDRWAIRASRLSRHPARRGSRERWKVPRRGSSRDGNQPLTFGLWFERNPPGRRGQQALELVRPFHGTNSVSEKIFIQSEPFRGSPILESEE